MFCMSLSWRREYETKLKESDMDEWRIYVQSWRNWKAEFELAWSMAYRLAHLGQGEIMGGSGKGMMFDTISSSGG